MRKIVIYHPFLSIVGGAELVIRSLAEYLSANNLVHVISHDEYRLDIPNVTYTNIKIPHKKFNLINNTMISREIKKVLGKSFYDILITSNAPPVIDYLISEKRQANTQHFCWRHDLRRVGNVIGKSKEGMKTRIRNEIYKKLDVLAYRNHYDKIIVYSEFMRNMLREKLQVSSNKIIKIPWGINTKSINQKPLTESKKVLYVGRIDESKNVYRLMEAMKIVRQKDKDSKLIIVGPVGEVERKRFFNMLKKTEDAVEYFGVITFDKREELQKLYEESQVVAYPTIDEPWGLVPLEAMANARPVIVGTGGSRESVENGVTGFYVNPFDVKDIAEKISNLLTSFDLCKTMGINGRKKVEREFDISKTYSAIDKLIEQS